MIEKGTNNILFHTDGNNFASMSASIQGFIDLKTDKQKVVILGDMLELGENIDLEHQKLGKLIAKGNFDLVVLFGKQISSALESLPKAFYFSDKFSLHNWLIDKQLKNSFIFINGSKELKLESILPFL